MNCVRENHPSLLTPEHPAFIDRYWLPMWRGAVGDGGCRGHAAYLLFEFPRAFADHIWDTSDDPEADWRMYHEATGLNVPPMPPRR